MKLISKQPPKYHILSRSWPGFSRLGFGVWGVGFGVWGFGFRVSGVGCGVWG